jgi:predicted RNA binding protein YcfA (HicA-like mRNA interferase family)
MSSRLPSLKPAEVIRILERNGFRRITKRTKHRIYTDGHRIVPVPFHRETSNRELCDPLFKGI